MSQINIVIIIIIIVVIIIYIIILLVNIPSCLCVQFMLCHGSAILTLFPLPLYYSSVLTQASGP